MNKQKIINLRNAEDPEKFILESAQTNLPNETKYQQIIDDYRTWYMREPKILQSVTRLYKLYYDLAKDHFLTDEQADDAVEDFLNS